MIYLSKRGKIEGPFTETEWTKMCKSGKDAEFQYIFNVEKDVWVALFEMPNTKPKIQKIETKNVGVALFELNGEIFKGELKNISQKGATIVLKGKSVLNAKIKTKLKGRLNLSSGKSNESAIVSVGAVEKTSSGLCVDLLWKSLPKQLLG